MTFVPLAFFAGCAAGITLTGYIRGGRVMNRQTAEGIGVTGAFLTFALVLAVVR